MATIETKCERCGTRYDPEHVSVACPHPTLPSVRDSIAAQQPPPQSILNLAVGNRLKIEDMERRLARLERELGIQDRILTELRRDLALNRYDPTKPLPDVMPNDDNPRVVAETS